MCSSSEPTLEQKKIYKNVRIACAEKIEKNSRIQHCNPDSNTKLRCTFDFEKHVNANLMSSCEEFEKVRPLGTQYEIIIS